MGVTTSLESAPLGERMRVVEVAIDAAMAAWLSAIGIAKDEEITVLRRAAFGGPLHLRLDAGGELAVGRDLAAQIRVERVAP